MSDKVLGKPHELLGYLLAPPPYPVHLLQDLIVKEGTYGMIFGEASSAKSLIAQGLMVALAAGEKFAGHFAVSGGSRNVMFLDLDQGADTSLRRFAKLVNWSSYDADWKEDLADHIFHYSPTRPFTVFDPAHLVEISGALNENKIEVLFIDCLARTLGGEEENESRTADMYLKAVRMLQEDSQKDGRLLTVVIIHHSRKAVVQTGGGKLPPHDDMRGASGWRDSLDFQIKAWKVQDVVKLIKLKERNTETPEGKWTFRLEDRANEEGDPVGVRFNYEPQAELINQGELLWSALNIITEGNKDKSVGIKGLSDILKEKMVKGIPHSPLGLRPIIYHLCETKRVQCSNQSYQARDPHKRFWTVAG